MRMPLRRRWARLKSRRIPAVVPVLAIALLLLGGFWSVLSARLRPAVETLAVSSATNRISLAVSQAVTDCAVRRELSYQDFVTMETDGAGRVTSLQSDLSAVGALRSELTAYVAARLEGLQREDFGIPLGTLTGWLIFSGKGPEIRIKLLSAGNVVTQIRHEFEAAGVNQTFHRVLLDVSVSVSLLLPGRTLPVAVDSSVCLAETVIVGSVPSTYLNIGNGAG